MITNILLSKDCNSPKCPSTISRSRTKFRESQIDEHEFQVNVKLHKLYVWYFPLRFNPRLLNSTALCDNFIMYCLFRNNLNLDKLGIIKKSAFLLVSIFIHIIFNVFRLRGHLPNLGSKFGPKVKKKLLPMPC